MDLGPGGLNSPGPSGFGGGYNATTSPDTGGGNGGDNPPIVARPDYVVTNTVPDNYFTPSKTQYGIVRAANYLINPEPVTRYAINELIKDQYEKELQTAQDILNAQLSGSQYFGPINRTAMQSYKNVVGGFPTPDPTINTGGDNIIPKLPVIAQTPSDIERQASDFDLYAALEGREAMRFGQNPYGVMGVTQRFSEGGIARQAYGLGSLVRKATKGIKKILKSDLGQAALLAAGTYYAGGGGNPFTAKGREAFEFGNIFSKKNPLLFTDGKLSPYKGIAAASALSGLLSTEEEEDNLDAIASRKDESGLRELIASYPALRFQVPTQYQLAAKGGRIGYAEAGEVNPDDLPMSKEGSPTFTDTETGEEVEYPYNKEEMSSAPDVDAELFQMYLDAVGSGQIPRATTFDQYKELMNEMSFKYRDDPYGPFLKQERTMANEGGLMSLGGNEMDLRGGGFVPIGKQEKADDVPARLSKNEFVFTADAVRAAGGGDVDKGADLMYKTMKDLESRVG